MDEGTITAIPPAAPQNVRPDLTDEDREAIRLNKEASIQRGLEAAAAEGVGTGPDQRVQEDYFGFAQTFRVLLPDGVSYIEHQSLNEGARRKYLNGVNREVRIARSSGDASIKTAPGDDRKSLLESAIVGWNLTRGGQPLPFNKGNLQQFLDQADPSVIDIIEKDVRVKNPWTLSDMTVEQIDKEIESLTELREAKVKEEEGKGA